MLIVLCGAPGSGKTTLSQQLAVDYNAKLYCFDAIPGAHHPQKCDSVRSKMWKDIATDLQNGLNVVCDDLHTKLKWRDGILSAVSGINCSKFLMVMNTPLEECLCRNANRQARLPDTVVESIYQKLESPTLEEGWDDIWYYE